MAKPSYELVYTVDDSPPQITGYLLAVQHVLLIATSFIFPLFLFRAAGITGDEAAFLLSMTIFVVGIGTLIQSLKSAYVGSGFLCPSFAALFYVAPSVKAYAVGGIGLVCGMTALSGVFQVAFSRIIRKLRMLFPPEVTGLVIVMAGVGGISFSIRSCVGLENAAGVADLASITIAVVTLAAIVITSVWGTRGMRLYTTFFGIAAGYIAAFALGQLPASLLISFVTLPCFSLPHPIIMEWSFDWALVLPFLIAGFAGSLKTIGNLTSCQKINDAKWTRPDIRNYEKGTFTDGLTNIFAGVFGSLGQSTSSGNIGLSLASGATSRKIGIIAGFLLIVISFCPYASFFFLIMPVPVMGALLIYTICFMVMTGIEIMMSRMMDTRKFFIIGFSFTFGLGASTLADIPMAESQTWLATLLVSPLTLSTLMAICLTLIFRIGIAKHQEITVPPGTRDLGDTVFSFIDRNGGAWGARRDVMTRAGSALFEFLEHGFSSGIMKSGAKVRMTFDEYNLDLFIEYEGEPVPETVVPPTPEELMEDPGAFSRLSLTMVAANADRFTVTSRNGVTTAHLHFDH